MSRPDWQLPAGVSRSLWEFALDPRIARDEDLHLANSPLLEFDRQTVARWFPDPGAVIDLGCGTGRLLIDLARRGWSGVGVDLSLESLLVAQERARQAAVSIALLRANLCDLNCLPQAHFDAGLLMFGTLGMVSGAANREAVIRQTHRLLKPGASLALHVHNVWRHLFLAQGRHWLIRDFARRLVGDPAAGDTYHDYRGIPQMHHHSFTIHELRRMLRSAGFVIEDLIALAPEPDVASAPSDTPAAALTCDGWFQNVRATGWLILARRSPD